ncbi:MAG: hypothetical protein HOE53_03805 [Candidatus Magasanikbacteria bacterium]|jgi:type II secretory pathway pseudopilin PulG|nr:hypothetical protein [Candidatus Magasanikbacteria bacterium]
MNTTSKKGFTLVELILYIGISGVFLLALSSMFIQILQSRGKHEVVSDVSFQGGNLMNEMRNAVHGASVITVPTGGVATSVLQVVSYDNVTTTFSLVGNSVQKEVAGNTVPLLTGRLIATSFIATDISDWGSSSTEMTFTLERESIEDGPQQFATQDFTSTITHR